MKDEQQLRNDANWIREWTMNTPSDKKTQSNVKPDDKNLDPRNKIEELDIPEEYGANDNILTK